MSTTYRSGSDEDAIVIDLGNPPLAAFLAWLWPGLGHFYQRRFAKGFLFMVCIASTFFYGLGLGQGRSVYASFSRTNDFRWQFGFQAGVGLPSMFALSQAWMVESGGDPLIILCERYPAGYKDPVSKRSREFEIIPASERDQYDGPVIKDGFMAPPHGPIHLQKNDVLGMWHAEMRSKYDIGTLFAIIAGLLNLLAIYDAFAGPSIAQERKPAQEAEEETKS